MEHIFYIFALYPLVIIQNCIHERTFHINFFLLLYIVHIHNFVDDICNIHYLAEIFRMIDSFSVLDEQLLYKLIVPFYLIIFMNL